MKNYLQRVFNAVPARLNVAIMIFTGSWANYMTRNNLSVNIVAMVPPVSSNTTLQSQCVSRDSLTNFSYSQNPSARQPDWVEYVDWNMQQQAEVLGAYYYGYTVSSFISGIATERWGPRLVVLVNTIIIVILTVFSPIAAKHSYITLTVLRTILGLCGGFIFPSFFVLISRWSTPQERGKFVCSTVGASIGTVFMWSVSGPVIEALGWEWGFYLPALLTLIWCFTWWYLVADSPADHPRISDREKKYIISSIGDKLCPIKVTPPFRKIFTSFPFLAMIVLHFGNSWGLFFAMNLIPKFIANVYGFNLTETGALSTMPDIARLSTTIAFGALGDCLVRRQLMRLAVLRKFFTIFSHVIPGLLVVSVTYAGCSRTLALALFSLSMLSNGAVVLTNLLNLNDLAPNFVGTMFGIANGIGNISGFITPLITAHFVKDGTSFDEWRPVFIIGGSVYILTGLYFILFGTTETQSWNYIGQDKEADKGIKINVSDNDYTSNL